MALTPDNVHVGPVRIFVNCTKPVTGDPPTKIAHTAGVPTPGDEVGYTEGDAVFSAKQAKTEINAEQSLDPIGAFVSSEVVQVTFTAMERTYKTLQQVFGNFKSATSGTEHLFYGGGAAVAQGVRTTCVVLTSPRPNQAGLFEVSVIYRAYEVEGYETAYRKSAPSTYKVTLKGLPDTTRVQNDQMFQHYIELS